MHIVCFVKTVLIIEDDRDTRAILSEILAGEGYEAVAVAFLQWLNKQEQLRKLPVAVLSALRVDTEKDKEPFRDHVVAVLRKPFTLEDVLELIESHCGTLPGTQEAA
ncbi:MAG: hypothetical protein E6J62_05465 [Deltaproteobacteria bacterium]|nr:MAG: hypothetical protein E6J62_05465 [Deltaproteobacteria bacterium]